MTLCGRYLLILLGRLFVIRHTVDQMSLEFMGRTWDKLDGDVQISTSDVDHANRGSMPDWKRPEWETSKAPKFQNKAPAFDLSLTSSQSMQLWHENWLREAYRVLKPGGMIKAFGGTRTFHRLAKALVNAGFEILPTESWTYGSGFPKSLNIGKVLDQLLGQPQEKSGQGPAVDRTALDYGGATGKAKNGLKAEWVVTTENTDAAKRWQGWGTALKPAWEPIVVGRKPLA